MKFTKPLRQMLALALAAAAFLFQAQADPITTLFNTGVATNNPTTGAPATFTADGTVDSHYALTNVPSGPVTTSPYVTKQGTFPLDAAWLPDNATSKWISPQPTYNTSQSSPLTDPVGDFTYQTHFDLTGFDLATVAIAGLISIDNTITSISLNGHAITWANENTFKGFANFGIGTGSGSMLLAGINTFTFVVNNAAGAYGNPTGLRVELAGTGTPVPEPGTLALVTGAGMLLTILLRRRSAASA